jgi:hypothetical protein
VVAASNPGEAQSVMVDNKDIERILNAVNDLRSNLENFKDDVNKTLFGLTTDVEVIKTKMEEREKSRGREDTQQRDLLKEHEQLLRGESIGLVSRVRVMEKWISVISWIGGGCILAVAVDIVLRIFHLI